MLHKCYALFRLRAGRARDVPVARPAGFFAAALFARAGRRLWVRGLGSTGSGEFRPTFAASFPRVCPIALPAPTRTPPLLVSSIAATSTDKEHFLRQLFQYDGSLWRVLATADIMPNPISTVTPTPIQRGGTCRKCAPTARPTISTTKPIR